jgi:universal stress protein F
MKRIVVGLDGSTRSADVLTAAVGIACAHGGRLVLVRSVGLPADVPQDFWKTTDEPLLTVLERSAKKYLQDLSATVPREVLDRVEVPIGAPWQALCDTARTMKADLLVIGSHGYGALDRLLGTTAAKVVNHAPCSVLVVREPQPDGAH